MAAILAMAAIGAWAVTTHQISYVTTHGVSMNPVYYQGDLVFVVKADSYRVGQIAAYHGPGDRFEVLHRIIGGDAQNGYIFKGDNNQSIDVPHPKPDELIGRAVLHIPHGGLWLQPLLSPTGLGMIGFLIIGSGTATATTRRNGRRGRRKKRANGMSGQGGSWAMAAAVVKAIARLHPVLRVIAVMTAFCVATGLVLGVLGWMKPATQAAPSQSQAAGESVTFSYSAKVKASAAYDGAVAYSPDPIYRKLAHFVDLQLQYRGKPGRINVDAKLSSEAGWHSTMQLSQARQFTSERYTGAVLLDLDGLDERVQAAAKAIGAGLGQILITVTAHVEHSDGTTFEPQLSLALSELQLTLANGSESMVVNQSGKTANGGVYPRHISVLGRDLISAEEARGYAIRLLMIAIVGIVAIGVIALRHVPLANRAQIQRRYGHLLVPVEPMTSSQGEAVITVASVPALVKLAEKSGQMILTWTRPDGTDDFVVRDDGVMYRYRIVPPRPAAAKPPLSGVPFPARRAQKSAALGIASVIGVPAAPVSTTEPEPPTEPQLTPEQFPEPAATLSEEPSLEAKVAAESAEPQAEVGVIPAEPEAKASAEPAEPAAKAESQPDAEAQSTTEEQVQPAEAPEVVAEPEKVEEPKPEPGQNEETRSEPEAEQAEQAEQGKAEAATAEAEAEAAPDPVAEARPDPAEKAETTTTAEESKTGQDETVAATESAPRVQPARRPRKRRPKSESRPESATEPKLGAQAGEATSAAEAKPEIKAADQRHTERDEAATTAVPEKEAEANGAPGPQKRTARRKSRTRRPAPEAEATAESPKAAEEPAADQKSAEELAAKQKRDQGLAAERQAAEELAERNKALDEAITRKAEQDQAASDRARKERQAKRTASRDPVYDFLPPKKD